MELKEEKKQTQEEQLEEKQLKLKTGLKAGNCLPLLQSGDFAGYGRCMASTAGRGTWW